MNDVSVRRFGYVRNSLDNDTARQPSGAARVEDEDGHRRNPTHLEAVLREIEMMKSLDHPTLLKLDEYFLDMRSSWAYLVMPKLDGGDLAEILAQRGRVSPADTRVIFLRVLAGLEFIHAMGVCHRDLKLENIMIARPGDLSSAVIADFGLACRVAHRQTGSLNGGESSARTSLDPSNLVALCGTPCYMPPEAILQLRRFRGRCFASTSHDMWAAGVLLHALLTGFFPYPSTSGHDELFQLIVDYRGIDRGGRHWEGVPEEAKDLVAGLLNPEEFVRLTPGQALSTPYIGGHPTHYTPPQRRWLADSAGSTMSLTSLNGCGSGCAQQQRRVSMPGTPSASSPHGAGGSFDSVRHTDDGAPAGGLAKMQGERLAARHSSALTNLASQKGAAGGEGNRAISSARAGGIPVF